MNQLNDCLITLSMLDQFLDSELSDRQYALIDQHLSLCAKCKAQADLERTLKDSVLRSCRSETMTDDLSQALHNRIMGALETTRIEWISGVVVTQSFTIEIREVD